METQQSDPQDVAADRDEVERLRRERDTLAAELEAIEARRTARHRVWRPAVGLLLVVGTLSFTLSAVGWWARRNLANTDMWIERVGPLADDPAIQAALGDWISAEVVDLVDPEALFAEVLPERGRVLAGPLSGAIEGFVHDRVDRFLASDRFEQLWIAANEQAHRAAVRVLRGDSEVVQARGDSVVINLVPVVNAALGEVGSASPELLGREVHLPDLTVDDLPDAATTRLEQALGVELDEGFGQFVVYDRGRLAALQDGIDQARRWLVGLSMLSLAAFGGALWLSDRRRRTLLQLLVGLAVGLAVIRRLGLRGQRELLAAVPAETNRAAAEAASDAFLDPLLAVTQTLLIVLAVVAAVLVISGPYPWTVSVRRRAVEVARGVRRSVGRAEGAVSASTSSGVWIQAHRSELQVGGVGLVVLVLLVFDLSFLGIVVLGALAALGGVVLSRVPAPVDAG